ncbi:MAG: hypothetical protein OEW21_00120 [Betaproteobacteria bacterium]|nr:hypothetical protein [Betaproteobacteria bacterium]
MRSYLAPHAAAPMLENPANMAAASSINALPCLNAPQSIRLNQRPESGLQQRFEHRATESVSGL